MDSRNFLTDSFEIVPGDKRVDAWSHISIGWHGKNTPPEELAFKTNLKAAVRDYCNSENATVARHAQFAGRLPKPSDVENVLTYNIQEWLGVSESHPVLRFEWIGEAIPVPPQIVHLTSPLFYYAYWTEPVDERFLPSKRFGGIVRSVKIDLPSSERLSDSKAVWKWTSEAVESSAELHPVGRNDHDPFGMRITLHAGASVSAKVFKAKPIFDGAVSAMHYDNGPDLALAAKMLTSKLEQLGLRIDETRTACLLSSRKNKILGPCGLFQRTNGYLQPADSLCHMGELRFVRHVDPIALSLTIEIFTL